MLKRKQILFFALGLVAIAAPLIGFAQVPTFPYFGPLVSCTGSTCTSLCDLLHTFLNVVYFGMTIVTFIAAPILFAWGGIMIIISAGNPGKIEQGKKILTGTLIGVLIALGAFLIVKTFITVLGGDVGKYIQGFTGAFSCTPP